MPVFALQPTRAGSSLLQLRDWIFNSQWKHQRPIGDQAKQLSSPETILQLEALIAGDSELIGRLREL